jgi:glutathione S-transferase
MIAPVHYRRATGREGARDFTRTANAGSLVSRKTPWGQPRVLPPRWGCSASKNGNDFGGYVSYGYAMKLYYNPRSRATIAKWMLDECGAAYEIVPVDLQQREHKAPEFLDINPSGKLPALVDGNSRIFEAAAICLYLGDKVPEANLAPRLDAPERGRYLSLMVYSTSQLEPAMGDALMGVESFPQRGWTDFETAQDVIEGELGDGAYLFGEWFTAADVMIGSMFVWQQLYSGRPSERSKIAAYVERLLSRPAAMKVGG